MINTDTSINIDSIGYFLNPFENIDISNQCEQLCLYRNYFSLQQNHKFLKLIKDKQVISSESENDQWTRSEILRSLACYYKYRHIPTIVNRDILKNKCGIIVHQVNCQGVMGSGLADLVRKKWPIVFEVYKKHQNKQPGMIQMILVTEPNNKFPLYVCNLFGQKNYGRGQKFTDYHAVRRALIKLQKLKRKIGKNLPIYFPHMIGCFRGGSNWEIYSKLIFKYFPESIICKYNPNDD